MYFYHLRLDLYPDTTTLAPPPAPQGISAHSLSYPTPVSSAQLSDAFSSSSARNPQPQPKTAQASVDRFQSIFQPFPSPPPRTSAYSQAKNQKTSASIPASSSSSQSKRSSSDVNKHPEQDYRFGTIRVACFDTLAKKTLPASTVSNKSKQSKNKKMTTAAAAAVAAVSNGPSFQESEPAQGILRLYKDKNEITTGDIHLSTQGDKDGTLESPLDREGAQIIRPDHGTAVCVLAVPSYMSPGDFLSFVGPVRSNVSHFRIIRDAAPNRFMVLMKFRTSEATDEFYSRYNGRTFNSMEPEICHVVYLKSIEIRAGCMPPYAFPFLNDDPFLQNHTASTATTTPTLGTNSDQDPFNASQAPTTHHPRSVSDADATGSPALAELPTCPVCLERMDSSVTGLLTILCQHTFHCHCLSKWGEGSCPVCRYSQKIVRGPANTQHNNSLSSISARPASTDEITEDQSVCALCGTAENLWICLICGHIGCGRYQEKHAYSHYYETSHLYALELETQRVWDYAGDGYVHRLIQNKTDGKLVELPSAVDGTLPSQHSIQVGQEKLDAIGLEYTYLLTSQLESQRLYFDAQMAAMTAQLAELNKDATKWEKEAILLDQKNRELAQVAEALEKEKVPSLIKEKKAAEKRLEKMQEKLAAMERQFEEEKEMNVGLLTNQKSFKDQLQEKEAEIAELQEQVRDMMIYLDTQQKIEQSSMKDELVNATIGVAPAPNASNSSYSSPSVSHLRRKGRK